MGGARDPGFAAGLAALAAIVAVPVLLVARLHGFDGPYGQDAFAYADYGLGPLRSAILAGHAPPDFTLPPGYPLTVAVASLIFGRSDAVAQGVSLLAGASIPVAVALLAREVLPDRRSRLALLAGLVAAVAGQLWQSSLVTMSDTTAVAAATLGAWAASRFHNGGQRRWLILAAAALAFAVETRIVFGVVAAVIGLLVLARLRADARLGPGRAILSAMAATLTGLVVVAPALVAMGAAVAAGRPVPFMAEFGVTAFDPLTPLHTSFVTADGHLDYRLPMLAWYGTQPVHWYWLAALGLALPLGIWSLMRGGRRSAPELTTLVTWPAAVLAVLVFYPYQNPRFFLAVLPPVAILVAIGLRWAWQRIPAGRRGVRAVTLAGIALAFGANAGLAMRYTDGFAARQAADLAAIRRLEGELPSGATLASLGATPALRHDGREVVELYNLAEPEGARLAGSRPLYVIVNAASMGTQWSGTSTGAAFERLAAISGFGEIDSAGAWTLFAVRS